MTTWQNFLGKSGSAPVWPYPVRYEQEQEIDTDILIVGGGIAGCWAAISAARNGVSVALVEKGATIRSGAGGPGCDHWCDCPTNPLSKVDADEWAQRLASGPYSSGIGRQIQCRENYDTLLELEAMGGKIRDTENKYVGVEGRDDETKFMISPRVNPFHETNVVIRIWGTTFKPALKKECERLGVKIYDRVMVTSFLTEGGIQGSRVIGATGLNNRTGEFMIFKSKAAVLATAGPGTSIWAFNTEQGGYAGMSSRNTCGDGAAMLFRAGGELTLIERNRPFTGTNGYRHMWYTGASDASYENVPLVDDNGKRLPVRIEGWGYKRMPSDGTLPINQWGAIREGVLKDEYALPFYGDFPAMPEVERNTTWGLMIGEESTTKIITKTYNDSGFDPSKDQLQSYRFLELQTPPQWREPRTGGVIVDWDLKTSLDGLYVAGNQIYSPGDHSFAASTGRYAGRKAAAYAKQIGETAISKEQVAKEKERVYAPIKREQGIEWKELHIGITRVMQYFCSEYKNEKLFNIALNSLKEIEEKYVPKLYALDPHKLMRSLEDLSILTYAQIILNASLARKASSQILDFHRIDYPEIDPPEWTKFLTIRLESDAVKIGERPTGYWGNLVENYEASNKDYKGVYHRK